VTEGGDLDYDDVVYNITPPLQPLSGGPCSGGVGLETIFFKDTKTGETVPNGKFPQLVIEQNVPSDYYTLYTHRLSYEFELGHVCKLLQP
jgi:hypothetical protein